jgi:hypothetical protein
MSAAVNACQTAATGLNGWPLAIVIVAGILAGGYVLGRLLS